MDAQARAVMHAKTNDETQDRETPQALFDLLNEEFEFDLDLAAEAHNTKCQRYFGPDHADPTRRDALRNEWTPFCGWLNPPYGEAETPCKSACKKKLCATRGYHNLIYRPGIHDFTAKAVVEAQHGATVVELVPVRTGSEWWQTLVPKADLVRFLKGRLTFEGMPDSAPFDSALIIFDGGLPARARGRGPRYEYFDWKEVLRGRAQARVA